MTTKPCILVRATLLGYRHWRIKGQVVLAHRLVYEDFNGPLDVGMHVHHTCENRACVEPTHLVAMTNVEHGLLHAYNGATCLRCNGTNWRYGKRPNGRQSRFCRDCEREYRATHPERRERFNDKRREARRTLRRVRNEARAAREEREARAADKARDEALDAVERGRLARA